MIWKPKKKAVREHELITNTSPKSAMAEAYRTLRTNLGFASMDQPCRSILVSSTNPQDGKSTVISNLAVVMAQAGHKVIIIDCDLRKPMQHKIFQVENFQGFTNCIMQKLDVEEVAHTGLVDNLTVLTSGPIPPNPAEILSSDRTRSLWKTLTEKYDYVFIDSPPVMAVTDASILSTQVDGVILVVRSGVTRIDMARNAKEQFAKANARLIGVVLNQVKMDASDYYQYYYYYSHESAPSKTSRFSF
jgi:capsular exopolysaccharide synthesis family protein